MWTRDWLSCSAGPSFGEKDACSLRGRRHASEIPDWVAETRTVASFLEYVSKLRPLQTTVRMLLSSPHPTGVKAVVSNVSNTRYGNHKPIDIQCSSSTHFRYQSIIITSLCLSRCPDFSRSCGIHERSTMQQRSHLFWPDFMLNYIMLQAGAFALHCSAS